MSNDLMIPAGFGGGVAPALASYMSEADELSSGIQGGFAVIGIRGKNFWHKHRGEEELIKRADDQSEPATSLELVIVKASPHLSKVYYARGFDQDAAAPPDCFSNDGVRPDPQAATPQCAACAACPMNVFGSRITDNGKKAKACSDSKRLAVVPTGDLENEIYGGPMLLRVPAASLSDMAVYGKKLSSIGQASFTVSTRIRFAAEEAFPKLVFQAVRPLSAEEGAFIAELRSDPRVQRILSEIEFSPGEAAPAASDQVWETPQEAAPVAPAPVKAAPVKAAPVRAAPTPVAPPRVAPVRPAAPVKAVSAPVRAAPIKAAPVKAAPTPVVEEEDYAEEGASTPAAPSDFLAGLDSELEALIPNL